MNKTAFRAVLLALASAFFFSFTYVLNRRAVVEGGHWAWTASLRYLFMMPMLALIAGTRGGIRPALRELRSSPGPWLLWSGIGFVVFYLGLCWSAASGPSWLIAGAFQLSVVAGMLLAPLLYDDERRRIPPVALALGLIIIAGVLLMQRGHARTELDRDAWLALACITVAAFAYPLGNRKLMLHLESRGVELGPITRLFGMTLASMPMWLLIAGWAYLQVGLPTREQVMLGFSVALLSGVVATALFFAAASQVHDNPAAFGAIEAMQSSEIVFATLMGVAFLGESWPSGWALVGAVVVIVGIVAFTVVVSRAPADEHEEVHDEAEVEASLPPLAQG